MSDEAVITIVSVGCVFGFPILWLIVDSVAKNWRKVRITEQNTILKRELLDRGYSPEEIVRVINAGVSEKESGCGRARAAAR